MESAENEVADTLTRRARLGLVLGPVLFALMLAVPAPAGLSADGWRVAATAVLMAVWWVTEPIPIPATALLPLALFPLLGVSNIQEAASPYANELIFLFMGGFMIALAMQRWGLHRRIALGVLSAVGTRPAALVGGFMLATAFISMWVSNTATAVMMLPIALSVVQLVQRGAPEGSRSDLPGALMLGIAYAASIGGFATLIGTPPNALLAGFVRQTYGIRVGFAQWMMVGVPMMLVLLPFTWLLLTRVVYRVNEPEIPGGRELIAGEMRSLGPVSAPERVVAVVFGLAALAWIVRPLLETAVPGAELSDAGIAITAALVLFLFPVNLARAEFVLDWQWAGRLPWDVLLLFGGGLSLADALTRTGVAKWIGAGLSGLGSLPTPLLVLLVCATIVFLSEIASNTATAAAFLPVVGSLAVGVGENPLLFVVPAALAASCGFMLPVATPPNAIAYATGHVSVPRMARAGLLLDLMGIAVILVVAYTLLLWAFGIQPGVLPPWATPPR